MQVTVSGLYPNNTAHILSNFTVCNSTIYIVDAVLVPAATLEAIPQINSTTPAGTTARITASPSPARIGERACSCQRPLLAGLLWGFLYFSS